MKSIFIAAFGIMIMASLPSCKKQLEAKSDLTLATPSTLADLQAILDNSAATGVEAASDDASADDYYISTTSYNGLTNSYYRSTYTWEPENVIEPSTVSDWGVSYKKIYYCNTALDALPDINTSDIAGWNNIYGQAIFKRAKTFFQVAVIWSLAYDPASSKQDLGIPLRLNSNFNELSVRSTVEETYERILTDLKTSIPLLPVSQLHIVRPNKVAAYAMLSRVYLAMRDYQNARLYADSALLLNSNLLDYNTIDPTPTFPFSNTNIENILLLTAGHSLLVNTRAVIDSNLYASYNSNDLRKALYFKSLGNNQFSYRGSYGNSSSVFGGLSTSELYLTRAECYARDGKTTEALRDLNALLLKRYKTGTFAALTASSPQDALAKILVERRKELLMRQTRWMDIKRLNKEGAGIVLKRIVNGQTYQLLPNDLRYALALPVDILAISGMQQNPR